MTLTLPDVAASPADDDRWRDVDVPPILLHAGRALAEESPRIERPPPLTFDRVALGMLSLVFLVASLPLGVMVADEDVSAASLQMASLALALAAFVAGAAFGLWAFRQRTTIDDLRWRSFRRPAWGGWWSVVWTITPAVALIAFSVIELLTDSLIWTPGVLIGLVAVRMMSLRALGTNMKRVVLGARRWARAGALATAVTDFLLVTIVWAALLEPQPDRDVLRIPSAIIPFAVLLTVMFSLGYAKRVERWVLEWWDNRWGCSERHVFDRLGAIGVLSGPRQEFGGRRLLPMAPIRVLVGGSYLALAATTVWSGWTIWTSRAELGDTSGLAASASRLDQVSLWFGGALLLMQVCHAIGWSAQAWNARRCTLGAPGIAGTAMLFLPAPAIVAVGVVVVDDAGLLALVVAFAVVVNMVCWALSFSLLGRMIQALGRPTNRIATWGSIVALHWVLLFGVRSIVLVDDADLFAGIVFAVAVLDAAIFLAAAVYSQLAMSDVERATRDYAQVRRRPVSRQRRRHRAPGGILVAATPFAPPSQP